MADLQNLSVRIPAMLRRVLLIFTLALLFGLGQQGAAVHAISHYADWQEQQQDKTHSTSACDKCVTYAKLASAVPAPAYVLPSVVGSYDAVAPHASVAGALDLRAYSARAPPAFS